jgi:hypothetical protein
MVRGEQARRRPATQDLKTNTNKKKWKITRNQIRENLFEKTPLRTHN